MKFRNRLKKQLVLDSQRKLSPGESDQILLTVLRKLVIGLTDSETHERAILLKNCSFENISEFLSLAAEKADPLSQGSASMYYRHAAIAAFVKKYPFTGVPGLNPLEKAKERSAQAEMLCRLTNKRLRYYRRNERRLFTKKASIAQVLHLARLKISNWLGPLDLNEIADNAKHGPGGCIGLKRPRTTAYYKYAASEYTLSPRCVPYAKALLRSDPLWGRALSNLGPFDEGPPNDVQIMLKARCKVTDYNKVTYVPKTAQTHRAIAVEPLLNLYFQLGIGSTLRGKLRRVGYDLDHCWAKNKKLAQYASETGRGRDIELSTIDLSMASDTLSIELVRDLLPPEWFDLMNDVRSHEGDYDGVRQTWAKFSSMGNGFTFELETMIFLALALSLSSLDGVDMNYISVFGDDIILPSCLYTQFCELLRFVGFKVNYDKTFHRGPFRESCGGDYYEGLDVRPFYLKRKLLKVEDLIFLRNNLYLETIKLSKFGYDPTFMNEIIIFIESHLTTLIRTHLLGPIDGPVDGVLFSDFDLACKSHFVIWDRNLHQIRYPVLRKKPIAYSGLDPFIYLQFIEGTRTKVDTSYKWGTTPTGSRSIVTRSMSTVTHLSSEIAHYWA